MPRIVLQLHALCHRTVCAQGYSPAVQIFWLCPAHKARIQLAFLQAFWSPVLCRCSHSKCRRAGVAAAALAAVLAAAPPRRPASRRRVAGCLASYDASIDELPDGTYREFTSRLKDFYRRASGDCIPTHKKHRKRVPKIYLGFHPRKGRQLLYLTLTALKNVGYIRW
eukprot:6206366-Pleurochrysis_carterae.AAC.3